MKRRAKGERERIQHSVHVGLSVMLHSDQCSCRNEEELCANWLKPLLLIAEAAALLEAKVRVTKALQCLVFVGYQMKCVTSWECSANMKLFKEKTRFRKKAYGSTGGVEGSEDRK